MEYGTDSSTSLVEWKAFVVGFRCRRNLIHFQDIHNPVRTNLQDISDFIALLKIKRGISLLEIIFHKSVALLLTFHRGVTVTAERKWEWSKLGKIWVFNIQANWISIKSISHFVHADSSRNTHDNYAPSCNIGITILNRSRCIWRPNVLCGDEPKLSDGLCHDSKERKDCNTTQKQCCQSASREDQRFRLPTFTWWSQTIALGSELNQTRHT